MWLFPLLLPINPVASELITINQSPYTEGIAHAELDKRISKLQCKAVAKALWAATTWEVAYIFTTETLNTITKICERHEHKQCALWVADVKDGFDLIFKVGTTFRVGTVVVDEYTAVMNNGRRSLPEDDFRSSLEDILKMDGYSFDSLESAALPSGGIKPRYNEPALTSRYIIGNWRQGENKAGRNFAIHRYEDGSGQLHLQAGDSGNATSSMRKRHDGAGVKISFKHENVAFSTFQCRSLQHYHSSIAKMAGTCRVWCR
ncbi:hypothetical protein SI65_06118 [Aspergillus cristatus]|uniref:Uncharacterized protein n=1 Tax=Aspergillus cristatus TaxID=573508 RepID=A0A1E3BBB2_ASPCR|nr:hypothetical protein SI65_06118 [Aspergillus cristatus]